MATKFSPCKGSYVLNQFPSNVMFGMNGFHVSISQWSDTGPSWPSCFNKITPVLLQGALWGYAALCDSSSYYFAGMFLRGLQNSLK